MPELPEVENVRRGLEPHLTGQRIARVNARRPDLRFPLPERFVRRLQGQTVVSVGRRGKYLLAELGSGEVLVMHLGMTGRFSVAPAGSTQRLELGEFEPEELSDPRHDHVVLRLAAGTTITYSDPRRFGYMLLVPVLDLAQHPLMRNLGVEPLGTDLTADYLARRARGRRTSLKAFLMDQRIIAGLGNIYVSEALFRSGLKPARPASVLARASGTPTEAARRLVPAIRSVMEDAIAAGGSTLRDYRHADGRSGAFQDAFSVYDREGEPCLRPGCRGIVRRTITAGRSTFHCPVCQR